MSEITEKEQTSESVPATFYDREYWAEGDGQLLWNMRKMLAFIMEISTPKTPAPFLTTMHKGDYDESWIGWYASWNEGGDSALYLEYEGAAFCVYAMDIVKDVDGKFTKSDMRFWYNFGDTDPKEKVNSWEELGDAVADAKAWLKEHSGLLAAQKENNLKSEFNIH